jgi:sorbitol/mannitol transport system permease protein
MNLPIAVWMMRSFLGEVPVEVPRRRPARTAAACCAPCSAVVIPMVLPGIAATSLDLLHLQLERAAVRPRAHRLPLAQTAPVFLTSFVTSQGLFLAKVCAAAIVVSLPVLIAGLRAQDKLVQGLSLGAVK